MRISDWSSDVCSSDLAGVFLEDQVWPKRCGHMSGKQVVPIDDYIQKLKAAVEAKRNKEFVIVARTDAIEPLGLDEAIRRGRERSEARRVGKEWGRRCRSRW